MFNYRIVYELLDPLDKLYDGSRFLRRSEVYITILFDNF
jgi:hypothetical protein